MSDARATFENLAADDFAAFPRDAEWLFCLSALTEVAAHLEDRERAGLLHDALSPYSQLNASASGEIPIGCVARYLGIAATAMEDWEEAERRFGEAIDGNRRMGARPWVAHTQHDYARMLLAREHTGDREQACELLVTALDAYRKLGMAPWIERAAVEREAVEVA